MNLFQKQLRRAPALSALLGLLLAAAVAFSAVGFAAWSGAAAQRELVDAQYTTIAVARDNIFGQGFEYKNFPGLLEDERHGFLSAHVDGCTALSAYEAGDYQYANDFDAYSRSLAVLAVRCTSASEEFSPIDVALYDEDGRVTGYEPGAQRAHRAEFSLESVVRRHPAYDLLPEAAEITWASSLFLPDGSLPFEVGKTYLVFGPYRGPAATLNPLALSDAGPAEKWNFLHPGIQTMDIDNLWDSGFGTPVMKNGNQLFSWEEVREDGTWYFRLKESSLPFCVEYQGDLQAFLDSAAGARWKNEILPMCEINYESADVILTDNVNSLLYFNTGDAALLEGRGFSTREYADGEAVCMVSAAYALKNGLSVGDEISLDFYRATLGYRENYVGYFDAHPEWTLVRSPCRPENRLGVKKTYTVVGIYTAPEFAHGLQSFQANTVFVPKFSVPNAPAYEDPSHPLLHSIVLKNGSAEEFEASAEAQGFGGYFAYYDQDYNALAETLDVVGANALRLLLLGAGAFLLAAALFLFLSFRRMTPAAMGMRRLGVSVRQVRRELLLAVAGLLLAAILLGAGLGAALYDAVTARVLSTAVALRPGALLACVGAQAVLLLAASAVWAGCVASRGLMQSARQRGRGGKT